jgi:hypothetical protein
MLAISRRMLSSKASNVRGSYPNTLSVRQPPKKKSGDSKSGDRGGHRFFETILSWKKFLIIFNDLRGANECQSAPFIAAIHAQYTREEAVRLQQASAA